jgi:hypothetical protein
VTDSRSITCSECQSQLEEFALDELAEKDRAHVAAHLAGGCSECSERLSEILSDFAQLAYSLPMERPTMRVDRTLRDRIAEERVPDKIRLVQVSIETRRTSPRFLTRGLIAAAVALAATILCIAAWTTRQNKSAVPASQQWAELQRRVEQADASQQFPAIPQMRFASLGTRKLEKPVIGYIVEDQPARQWHVYALNLPKLPEGHVYQMWFDMGNSRFVRAGTAEVDDTGTIHRLIDVPSDLGAIHGLAISDEANNDTGRPTGENLLEATLQ